MSDYQYFPDFVSAPKALFETVRDTVAWTDQMKARRTASMGLPYNYKGASYPINPWLPAVDALRTKVEAIAGFWATNCLLNYYPTGAHKMGWHTDDVEILAPGTGIAILSLGTARPLGLRRHGSDGYVYEQLILEPGSLLLMSAAMQSVWQHALRPVPEADARISVTFRHLITILEPVP